MVKRPTPTAHTARYRTAVWLCSASLALLLPGAPASAGEFPPPPLMLAKVWHGGVDLADYLVSEKLDGVRAYWDGNKLLTRGGERINAPTWFTAGWPAEPMDGELWLGRNQFSQTVSVIRRKTPDDDAWRGMHYMVFDLPAQPGPFSERLVKLEKHVKGLQQAWLRPVEQRRVANPAALQEWLQLVLREGGEGLMLHRAAAPYRGERSDDLLKLKPFEDADARVIAHLPGQGKNQGRLGALLVETSTGQRFSLGSGLADSDRLQPPPLGSWVTYRFNGRNEESGLPRFARYLRRREDVSI